MNRILAALFALLILAPPAHATLALDGTPAQVLGASGSTTCTTGTNLTTTNAYGKVVVFVIANTTGVLSGVTVGGASLSLRAHDVNGQGGSSATGNSWEYAGDVGSSALSGAAVVATFSVAPTFCTISAFVISDGGNSNGVAFDGSAVTNLSVTGTACAITTTHAVSVPVGGSSFNADNGTASGGWTGILSNQTGSFTMSEYQGPTVATGTFTYSSNKDGNINSCIVDALISGTAGGGGAARYKTLLGVGK